MILSLFLLIVGGLQVSQAGGVGCAELLLPKAHLVYAYEANRSETLEPKEQIDVFNYYGLKFEVLEPGSYVVLPQDKKEKSEMAILLQTLMVRYNIRFQSELEPTSIKYYSAKWDKAFGQHVMYLPLEFFINEKAALKQLRQFLRNAQALTHLVQIGEAASFSETLSSHQVFVIQGKADAPEDDSLKWIADAIQKYGVEFYMGDEAFLGDMADADAFSTGKVVWFKTQSADLRSVDSRYAIRHELAHAVHFQKCREGENCGKIIEFHSDDMNLMTGGAVDQHTRGAADVYKSMFRSDEVEAYWISAQQALKDGAIQQYVQQMEISKKFKDLQLHFLEEALSLMKDTESDGVLKIEFREGSVELKVPGQYKGSIKGLIQDRIKELESFTYE